jgi:putative transposase
LARIARKVTLTDKQKNLLRKFSKSRVTPLKYQQRSSIILLCFQGKNNGEIAKELDFNQSTVSKWRLRWSREESKLLACEGEEDGIVYQRSIQNILDDAPRPGAPPKFTAEQVCQIISVSCEVPSESDLPFSHWSLPSLAQEVVKRNIVESISTSQLHVFLKSDLYQAP